MERWGVFSVIDHKDPLKLVTDLLLYDKIAVPTPMDRNGDDWNRWQREEWEPEKLMAIVDRLKQSNLVIEAEWDLDRQKNWRKCFEEAKVQIDKVNAEIQCRTEERVVEAKKVWADHSAEDRDNAVRAAAYNETRNEIIRHLRGNVEMYYGPVEFYAAYQSEQDFEQLHLDENPIKRGVEQVNFLVRHQIAVPDEGPESLLDRVIGLAMDTTYKDRRKLFYEWQIDLVQRHHKPKAILRELDQIVSDFNRQATRNGQKCRSETVITVLVMNAALVTGWNAIDPSSLIAMTHMQDAPGYAGLMGSVTAAGVAVWRRHLSRKQVDDSHRIAAPGAMFHQMGTDIGFEFRRNQNSPSEPPSKF